jgi:hypothetical protein
MGRRGAARAVIAAAAGGLLVAGLASAASAAPGLAAAHRPAEAAAHRPRPPVSAALAHPAQPAFVTRPHAVRLPAGQQRVCGVPSRPGQMACQAIIETAGPAASAGGPSEYGPSSLQSAYGLTSASARRGRGETVAIVDAYSNPDLARNLAAYRRRFRLPACGTSSGCLRIVNQAGRSGPLPRGNASWGVEESLDLDMVSAICPHCRILLVEAKSASTASLGTAELTAVAKGARFVSNSWSGGEFIGQDADDHYFNHPGDAIVVASGDSGYGAAYPTDLPYVTAVGGTKLVHRRSGGRAWTETAWGTASNADGGTGSGCSTLEPKPSWQHADDSSPRGCLNRTENDVSADADPATGVAVDDTYKTSEGTALFDVGGTSAATPIITATYALAGNPARGTYPASYPYQHASHFNDVRAGANGRCEPDRQYLCHGERGYDGPTGLGTPKGYAGLSASGVRPVTVLDPGTQDAGAGAPFRLTVAAVDSDGAAKSLAYTARGLPAGLAIGSAAGSLDGAITGTLPAKAGSYKVTVTAKDRRSGRTGSAQFELSVIPSLTTPSLATAGDVIAGNGLDGTGCLSAASLTAGTAVVMDFCDDAAVSQQWNYVAGAGPGAPGSLSITSGTCLGLAGTRAVLQACNGAAGQRWEYQPTLTESASGEPTSLLYNPASRRCLNGGNVTAAGGKVVTSPCSVATSADGQEWDLNAGLAVVSGRAGDCMTVGGASAASAACAPSDAPESWQVSGGLYSSSKGCLQEKGLLDGQFTSYESCGDATNTATGFWVPGPGGELINVNSGRCLDDTGTGARLVQEDCYGLPGEIWALN